MTGGDGPEVTQPQRGALEAISRRFETLSRFGLRHKPNETLLAEWRAAVDAQLAALGLHEQEGQ